MKYKWYLFWTIIIFCVLGTISLSYIAYTSTPPTNSTTFIEVTKTVFLCLGGLGVILPLYINATNAIESRITDKIENTFALIEKWDDPHLFEARKLTREICNRRSSISDEALIEQIQNNEDLKQSVILLANYFEAVRFSIINERIDKKQFSLSLGFVIKSSIQIFEPYFKTCGQDAIDDLKQLAELLK